MARKIDDELRQMLKEEADEMLQESNQPTTLLGRFFQEVGDGDDDSDEDEGESLEDIEKDMEGMDSDDDDNSSEEDNDDDSELGKDNSDVQNEYDENELNTLNELIADEQHAMQQYFKAGKETKNVLLSRLYSDIGAEEAFHSEQLLYAKAELTGERYEPSDPEVKKEYEELLENGMDEETAMYTVADKHKLDVEDNEELDEDLEDIEKDLESLGESFTMTMAGIDLMMSVQESVAYKNHKELRQAYCEYFQCVEETMFMEAMDNVATTRGSEILGSNNPFFIIGKMIKTIYTAILNLVRKIKAWVNKRRVKSKRVMAWLKKHGIKGLFANGVKLYCWNDQTNQVEVSDYVAYLTLLMNATHLVANKLGINPPNIKRDLSWAPKNNSKVPVITTPKDAIDKINGVVFSKSKIIVTDANAVELENMFFGLSKAKIQTRTHNSETGEYGSEIRNINIYNALTVILEAASACAKATDEWLPTVQNTITTPGNNAATKNPTIYKECVDLMKEITKGYQKMIKCMTADISTCMKLDQGLLAAVQQGEKGHSEHVTDVLNGRNDERNSAGKQYAKYGDAANSIGPRGTSIPRMNPSALK